ncbi:hypothetical protein HELRODRAFT_186194 [Helobdella robusta]|uniref:SGF29 C-terminal domain-containing protein n=1 Tax=Helobdella robusta TaxID=6412 RepID=T1FNS9_HELRO|nr:hypothetical protein HELRODRAFT_186194 [Helobdella robusta]ESN91015.1 hypothetical protein HELRODRAFT_186194 [Helobdella robusta]
MGRLKTSGGSTIKESRSSNNNSSDTSGVHVSVSNIGLCHHQPMPSEQRKKEMWRELQASLREFLSEKERSDQTMVSIQKIHDRVSQESRGISHITPYYRAKLRALCTSGAQDTDILKNILLKSAEKVKEIKAWKKLEMDGCSNCNLTNNTCLSSNVDNSGIVTANSSSSSSSNNNSSSSNSSSTQKRHIVRRGVLMSGLQQDAHSLPLWSGKLGEKPPSLCGAIPADNNYVGKPGDKVAARVKGQDDEENWILAEIVSYNSLTSKYDVDDIDAEEGKERHSLGRRRVVPLPVWKANPETDPGALFTKDTLVLALYPQTTCFYRALIHEPPRKSSDNYSVLFEDTSYPDGYSPPLHVAQRYVIVCKEDKKK